MHKIKQLIKHLTSKKPGTSSAPGVVNPLTQLADLTLVAREGLRLPATTNYPNTLQKVTVDKITPISPETKSQQKFHRLHIGLYFQVGLKYLNSGLGDIHRCFWISLYTNTKLQGDNSPHPVLKTNRPSTIMALRREQDEEMARFARMLAAA